MVKAQQIEKDGTPFGAVRTFTDGQWNQMKSTYGSRLRWVLIQEVEEPEEIEYPEDEVEIKEDALRERPDNMTKKMIIREHNLPDEDIKLSRGDLIEKVVNKQ